MSRREWVDHSSVLEAIEGLRPQGEGWVYAVCPFCSETGSSKRRLSFNVESGWYRCWNPGCQIDSESGFLVTNWVSVPSEKKVAAARPQLKLPDEFVCLTDSVRVRVSPLGLRYYRYFCCKRPSGRC